MKVHLISDNIQVLWNYLEGLMTKFNIQPQYDSIIAIAYDTRFAFG